MRTIAAITAVFLLSVYPAYAQNAGDTVKTDKNAYDVVGAYSYGPWAGPWVQHDKLKSGGLMGPMTEKEAKADFAKYLIGSAVFYETMAGCFRKPQQWCVSFMQATSGPSGNLCTEAMARANGIDMSRATGGMVRVIGPNPPAPSKP